MQGETPHLPEPQLTILMPCLNEARTLPSCVAAARSFLARSGIGGEILIADNGSTDGSQQLARELGARVIDVRERGYGAALHHGILAARGKYVVMGDCDQSYDFEELDGFVERLNEGCDLVMGNRFKGGIVPGAMPLQNRYLGNPLLSALGRYLFSTGVGDVNCGLRALRRDSYLRLDLQTAGMEYASEMVLKAALLRFRVAEVPIILHRDGRGRPPHMRPWRDGWRNLRFMLLFSPRWLFLYPGLAFMLGGLLVGTLVLLDALDFGTFGFGVHTLAFAGGAVILGVQGTSFWLMARVFAEQNGLLPARLRVSENALEYGVGAGLLLVLAGLVAGSVALHDWSRVGFGGLDEARVMRIVIPSITAMAVGLQIALLAFFLGVLRLRRRGQPPVRQPEAG